MSQHPEAQLDIETLHAAILAHDPTLAGLPYVAHHAGWDSVAIDVDDRLIFKFPRQDIGVASLLCEARLIAAARTHVRLAIPDLSIVGTDPVFSRHTKIPGAHLLPEHYAALPEAAREALATDMARFFADLHALPRATMEAAGAGPVEWYDADTIAARALPLLDPPLRNWAETTLADWLALGADPYGEVYGFFDGHGWNMAFDHERRRLNGIYDFGDSGIAPLHQEFVYPGLVARDLITRILPHYEQETGRTIDRHRVMTLAGVHRLFEVAQHHDDPPNRPAMLESLAQWADT
jgi:aminoglycoside phosphotransferase (APT) family kinase protein